MANDWAGLTSGSLLHAINVDETGTAVVESFDVWTNVATSGARYDPSFQCSDWSSLSGAGWYGFGETTGSSWTAPGTSTACGNDLRLYCFGQ